MEVILHKYFIHDEDIVKNMKDKFLRDVETIFCISLIILFLVACCS